MRRALVVSGVYRCGTLSLALHATTTPVYTQRGAKQRLGVMKSAYVRVRGCSLRERFSYAGADLNRRLRRGEHDILKSS